MPPNPTSDVTEALVNEFQWIYHVFRMTVPRLPGDDIEVAAALSSLGLHGWELVSAVPPDAKGGEPREIVFVMKRRRPQEVEV